MSISYKELEVGSLYKTIPPDGYHQPKNFKSEIFLCLSVTDGIKKNQKRGYCICEFLNITENKPKNIILDSWTNELVDLQKMEEEEK